MFRTFEAVSAWCPCPSYLIPTLEFQEVDLKGISPIMLTQACRVRVWLDPGNGGLPKPFVGNVLLFDRYKGLQVRLDSKPEVHLRYLRFANYVWRD